MLSIVNNYEEDLRNIKERKIIIKDVNQQTPELCLAGVKAYAWNILYIKEQTPEICLEAVKGSSTLYLVKKQTPEICLAAVKKDGLSIQHVEEQTHELCLDAVRENGWAVEYVKDQTLEICVAALFDDLNVSSHFRDPLMKNKIKTAFGF